jgi:hypothetical protein
MKRLILFFAGLLFFAGCGKTFFDNEMILNLKYKPVNSTQYLYYNEEYNFRNEELLQVDTHFIIKLGENENAFAAALSVTDGDMIKLAGYDARLIKKGGSEYRYDKSSLYVINMSGKEIISKEKTLILRVKEKIDPGDIVEVNYRHNYSFPRLGARFLHTFEGLPAANIGCSIYTPQNVDASFLQVNDNVKPVETVTEDGRKKYDFRWDDNMARMFVNPYAKKIQFPYILIGYPFNDKAAGGKYDWKSFGNWYLDLISNELKPDFVIKEKAAALTKNLTDDKEKMDAIFEYCQKNVRYEQVYFDYGAIVPNKASLVFDRGYGDCKDYSALIYSMARSVGLNPSIALCFRGRGFDDFYNIPVSQFNHMITCFNYKNRLYWYDGTNRDGTPGVTTSDLINQKALLLEKDNSRIVVIEENGDNLLSITGSLKAVKTDLSGKLKIKFFGQFAVDFRYCLFAFGKKDFDEYVNRWLRTRLNDGMTADIIAARADREAFEIELNCRMPNALISIDSAAYLSVKSALPNLIPKMPEPVSAGEAFYNPAFNKCGVEIKIENLFLPSAAGGEGFLLKQSFNLPAGPFGFNEVNSFIRQYKKVNDEYSEKIKLIEKGL